MTFKQHSDRLSLAALRQISLFHFRPVENRCILTPLFILGEGCSILIKVHFLYYSQGPLSIKTSSLVQCIVKCFQFFFFSDLNLLARHQRGTCKNVNLCVPLVSAQTESYEHLRKNFETGRATPSVKTAAC